MYIHQSSFLIGTHFLFDDKNVVFDHFPKKWLNLLCRQSALRRSLHFSWHFTPHSVQRTPWDNIEFISSAILNVKRFSFLRGVNMGWLLGYLQGAKVTFPLNNWSPQENCQQFQRSLGPISCCPNPQQPYQRARREVGFWDWAAIHLSGNAPQEPLALVAVGGRGGRPEDKVVRSCARDWVDQRLQRLLVHMHFLGEDIGAFFAFPPNSISAAIMALVPISLS